MAKGRDLIGGLAVGELAYEGSFSLDAEKAREKLSKFSLADPHRYVLLVVGALTRLGAARIAIEIDGDDVRFVVPGALLEVAEVRDLFAYIFRREDARTLGLRDLAFALNAAMALAPSYAIVERRSRGRFSRLRLGRGGAEAFEEGTCSEEDGVSVHVREAWGLSTAFESVQAMRGLRAEQTALRHACRYARVPVVLDGAPIGDGTLRDELEAGQLLACERVSAGGLDAEIALTKEERAGEVRITVGGVWLTTRRIERAPSGMLAVVEAPGLRKDASQEEIIEDEAYVAMVDALVGRAQALQRKVVEAWRNEHAEGAVRPLHGTYGAPPILRVWVSQALAGARQGEVAQALGRAWMSLERFPVVEGEPKSPQQAALRGQDAAALGGAAEIIAYVSTPSDHLADQIALGPPWDRVLIVDPLGEKLLCALRGHAVAVDGVLAQVLARERRRIRWRGRPSAPTLEVAQGWAHQQVTAGDLRGELAIAAPPTAAARLSWVVDGHRLDDHEARVSIPGLTLCLGDVAAPDPEFVRPLLSPTQREAIAEGVALALWRAVAAVANRAHDSAHDPGPASWLTTVLPLLTTGDDVKVLAAWLGVESEALHTALSRVAPGTLRSSDDLRQFRWLTGADSQPLSITDLEAMLAEHASIAVLDPPSRRKAAAAERVELTRTTLRLDPKGIAILRILFADAPRADMALEHARALARRDFEARPVIALSREFSPALAPHHVRVHATEARTAWVICTREVDQELPIVVFHPAGKGAHDEALRHPLRVGSMPGRVIGRRNHASTVRGLAVVVVGDFDLARDWSGPTHAGWQQAVDMSMEAIAAFAAEAAGSLRELHRSFVRGVMTRGADANDRASLARLRGLMQLVRLASSDRWREIGDRGGATKRSKQQPSIDDALAAAVSVQLSEAQVRALPLFVGATGERVSAQALAASASDTVIEVPAEAVAEWGDLAGIETEAPLMVRTMVSDGLDIPATEAGILIALTGLRVRSVSRAWLDRAIERSVVAQRPTRSALEFAPGEAIAVVRVEGRSVAAAAGVRGVVGLPTAVIPTGLAPSIVEICERGRVLARVEVDVGLPMLAILDYDAAGLTLRPGGVFEVEAARRSAIESLLGAMLIHVRARLAEELCALAKRAASYAEARAYGSWALATVFRAALANPSHATPSGWAKVPVFLFSDARWRIGSEAEEVTARHGCVPYVVIGAEDEWQALRASPPSSPVAVLFDARQAGWLRTRFASVGPWEAVHERVAALDAALAIAPRAPEEPGETLASATVRLRARARARCGSLWIARETPASAQVHVCVEGRSVQRMTLLEPLWCEGVVEGPGITPRVGPNAIEIEVDGASRAALRAALIALYTRAARALTRSKTPHAIAPPWIFSAMIAAYRDLTSRDDLAKDERKLLAALEGAPLLEDTDGRLLSIAHASSTRPLLLVARGLSIDGPLAADSDRGDPPDDRVAADEEPEATAVARDQRAARAEEEPEHVRVARTDGDPGEPDGAAGGIAGEDAPDSLDPSSRTPPALVDAAHPLEPALPSGHGPSVDLSRLFATPPSEAVAAALAQPPPERPTRSRANVLTDRLLDAFTSLAHATRSSTHSVLLTATVKRGAGQRPVALEDSTLRIDVAHPLVHRVLSVVERDPTWSDFVVCLAHSVAHAGGGVFVEEAEARFCEAHARWVLSSL